MERRYLALAERHFAEGDARLDEQLALIDCLKVRGQKTETAEESLALLR